MTAGGDLPYRSGVGIILLNRDGEAFVGRRIDTPGDAWQMPQGGIDADEPPCDAALRELEEEIGTDKALVVAESEDWLTYEYPPDLVGVAWDGRYRGQRQKWFLMRFTGDDSDIALETEHPEFNAWKWVPLKELPHLTVAFKRQVYLDVLVEFRALCRGPT